MMNRILILSSLCGFNLVVSLGAMDPGLSKESCRRYFEACLENSDVAGLKAGYDSFLRHHIAGQDELNQLISLLSSDDGQVKSKASKKQDNSMNYDQLNQSFIIEDLIEKLANSVVQKKLYDVVTNFALIESYKNQDRIKYERARKIVINMAQEAIRNNDREAVLKLIPIFADNDNDPFYVQMAEFIKNTTSDVIPENTPMNQMPIDQESDNARAVLLNQYHEALNASDINMLFQLRAQLIEYNIVSEADFEEIIQSLL